MRFGILSGPIVPKILKPVVLVVVLIGLVSPGGGVAFSQSGTGSQAPMFIAIDLNPSGFQSSAAEGISGGQQVGYGDPVGHTGHPHALLWRGSAASVVDLHPSGFTYSMAHAICGDQQVGSGIPPGKYLDHALMWRGSPTSVVDLHPSGLLYSSASAVSGGQQVGSGGVGECCGAPEHALLWHGSAANVVDLHPNPSDFSNFRALGIWGEQQVGWGAVSVAGGPSPPHALLWRGSATSVVDLHPSGFEASEATGISGDQQVGSGIPQGGPRGDDWMDTRRHALLWRGSAASVVDLHPHGFSSSEAHGTNGEEQVGEGGPNFQDVHALLWRGSATSVVDLHVFLPPGFVRSKAWAIDTAGDIVGSATGPGLSHFRAFLWKRNVSGPATSQAQNAVRCSN